MTNDQKIDFSSIDWVEVLARFGINVANMNPKKHYPCPLQPGDEFPRFRFDNKAGRGTWICSHCGAGDGVKLVAMAEDISVSAAIFKIKDAFSNPNAPAAAIPKRIEALVSWEKTEDQVRQIKSGLQRMWDSASTIAGSPVEKYLLRRVPGLDPSLISQMVKYHPRLEYRHDKDDKDDKGPVVEYLPGMVARVVDKNGVPVTIHRTYVSADGYRADVPKRKKLMPGVRTLDGEGVALNRSHGDSDVLIVCEGIETGLALVALTRNRHEVWAMLNAGNLAKAKIPKRFRRVVIAADRDKINRLGFRAGEHYAEILCKRLVAEGFLCSIRVPEEEGVDYCDLWARKQAS